MSLDNAIPPEGYKVIGHKSIYCDRCGEATYCLDCKVCEKCGYVAKFPRMNYDAENDVFYLELAKAAHAETTQFQDWLVERRCALTGKLLAVQVNGLLALLARVRLQEMTKEGE